MLRPVALLITGTSHCGKSTLAARLGAALGWPVTSTDGLARHPGRPWGAPGAGQPPVPVGEFYDRMSPEGLLWFLQVHHANMRPVLRAHLASTLAEGNAILEGNALRPVFLATELLPSLSTTNRPIRAICLHADDGVLRGRIRTSAGYDSRDTRTQARIDAFTARCLADQVRLVDEARAHGIACIDVSQATALDTLAAALATELSES